MFQGQKVILYHLYMLMHFLLRTRNKNHPIFAYKNMHSSIRRESYVKEIVMIVDPKIRRNIYRRYLRSIPSDSFTHFYFLWEQKSYYWTPILKDAFFQRTWKWWNGL